ncbi:alpha-protein kinase 1 isoform X2 [Amphiprion ocellaris]|uniref:alpha-protein kinase 1 isoform X2 n=1 Tax=Amphiprion ocellaris TaxID=80972 RepID=UPI0024116679|nr:alpha-protein kinase 1 isoform X2 [Amphiprion ocellaris]
MDSQEVGDLLEECLKAAAPDQQSIQLSEAQRLKYCSCRDSLCAELASLLQEAEEMKWPFVPEKWQYKQSVSADDKTNLSELISKHLPQLLAFLKASITAQEARSALAVVFLVDRFLYWSDESSRLLKIAKLLHRRHPYEPIAPQLVIRQARVYLNSGKLQKAEYILSSLINNNGATGCWEYRSESDEALVQAVSLQVRGMILQKLGLWLEAAELIWASLVGYYSLPQPDKKGIGTSLGILANILVSMNDEDFRAFRTNRDADFSLLGDGSHRLLSAAQTAKMAVVYSQYTSLYVLTHVTTQGTCFLSYSFSVECPASQRRSFLLQAKEAFGIGLLTIAEGELVTSKQELHTFLKAAYSLTVTHKWLGTPGEVVDQAAQACQEALAKFYEYCKAKTQNKENLCTEIMHLVAQVKLLLQVEPFPNSDKQSFIPDSYRNVKDTSVHFTMEGFSKVMQRFQKYHESLCKTINGSCRGDKDEMDRKRLCLTALGTTIGPLSTECTTEACKEFTHLPKAETPQQRGSDPSFVHLPQKSALPPTLGSTDSLGSSWQDFSLSSSGSPQPSSSGYTGSSAKHGENPSNQSCLTTEVDDDRSDSMLQSADENNKQNSQGFFSRVGSYAAPNPAIPAPSSSNAISEKFTVLQAEVETLSSEEDWMANVAEGAVESLSQVALKTSSSSLSDTFSSQSSWEKISADLNSPIYRKPQPSSLSKPETSQISKSPDSDGSFYHMETFDSATSDSALDHVYKNHMSGGKVRASSKPQPLESLNVFSNMETEIDSVPVKHANNNSLATPHGLSQALPEQCADTEASSESSFEMLEMNQHSSVTSTDKVDVPQSKNPLCYSCLNPRTQDDVVPTRQYLLSLWDYQALLAGVCHKCLLKRLHSDKTKFKLKEHNTAYNGLHLKFSKATGLWTAKETCVYIGEVMMKMKDMKPEDMKTEDLKTEDTETEDIKAEDEVVKGSQRLAIWVQFLHQEERLSSYVGKDYLVPKEIQFHLKDVERQMTAQYYVTEFNKSLYDKKVMAQIFFIPSEALLILNRDEIVGCVTVEPYMLGDFVKLTNNTVVKEERFKATEYGLAFGHFTYLFSNGQEIVVDLQGWVTANGKGLTYLTDPQIHSTRTPKECWKKKELTEG